VKRFWMMALLLLLCAAGATGATDATDATGADSSGVNRYLILVYHYDGGDTVQLRTELKGVLHHHGTLVLISEDVAAEPGAPKPAYVVFRSANSHVPDEVTFLHGATQKLKQKAPVDEFTANLLDLATSRSLEIVFEDKNHGVLKLAWPPPSTRPGAPQFVVDGGSGIMAKPAKKPR
jgi:hypothetical protein